MPKDQREPQSYGSNAEWVTGRTGQEVNDQNSEPAPEHQEFYDERRESETNAAHEVQGGQVSEVQLADNAQADARTDARPADEHAPIAKVATAEGGTKMDGYFKKRDYE